MSESDVDLSGLSPDDPEGLAAAIEQAGRDLAEALEAERVARERLEALVLMAVPTGALSARHVIKLSGMGRNTIRRIVRTAPPS